MKEKRKGGRDEERSKGRCSRRRRGVRKWEIKRKKEEQRKERKTVRSRKEERWKKKKKEDNKAR